MRQLLVVALALFTLSYIAGTSLSASGAHKTGVAISSMRSVSDAENFCAGIQSQDVTLTLNQINGRLATALWGNTTGDWHGLASSKVYFGSNTTDCNFLGFDLLNQEIRYWVNLEWASPCGTTGINCEFMWGTYQTINGTHYYQGGNIYIREAALYNHVINHETGHALGLADPGSCTNDSVMHESYYCGGNTNYAYPTTSDQSSVSTIANN